MNPINTARTSLSVLLFASIIAILCLGNSTSTAYAQAPAKKSPAPPPPPDDPLVRIESALDKLDKRLSAVEGDVATLKKDVASLKGDKAAADKKAKALDTRVASVESRVTTLEQRPPLTVREYRTVYKTAPPTYIYVREPGVLTRRCYSYVENKLHLFDASTTTWIIVTK